jgi:hypothetical protein
MNNFSQRKILETPVQWEEVLPQVFSFIDNESYDEATYSSRRLYKLKPILDHLNAKFKSVMCQ